MNSSFPDRWSFSYLEFTKICHWHNAEPKYKYGQQEQVTVRNHNRSTALERSVLKYWGAKTGFTGSQPRPRLLSWLRTYSCSVRVKVFVTKWIKSCLLSCFGTFKMPFLMFISILVFRPEGQIWNPVRRDTKIYVRRILNASRISTTQLNSCTISPS